MAFDYEKIIQDQKEIIDDLVYHLYRITKDKQDFIDVLREATSMDDETIENYVADLFD